VLMRNRKMERVAAATGSSSLVRRDAAVLELQRNVNVLNDRPSFFCWSTPWGVEAQTLVSIPGGEWVRRCAVRVRSSAGR
jgi:hypothetical protein